MPRALRYLLIALVAMAVLCAGAYYFALHTLKGQVIRLLGDQSEYSALHVSLTTIVIEDLRIRADPDADSSEGWPAGEELRAARVTIEPDLRTLPSDNILISRIHFEQAYLPVMRLSGKVRFLPTLLENRRKARIAKGEEGAPPKKYVHVAHVDIDDSDIDFYDATISHPPHRLPLRHVSGTIDQLKFPTLDEEATLDLKGNVSANGNDGKMSLRGKLVPRTRDSKLTLQLRGVDLRLLEPYFIKATRADVESGTLDMDVTSTVRDRALEAPGTLVLHKMKLDGGLKLGGMSRRLALKLLEDEHDRIDLQFTLAGNLGNPKFSLNEELSVRVGAALARSLGVSIESLGKGVLGIGESVGSLLGGKSD
ncbi:MAG: hypothetical protein JWL63_1504 [Rhodocyclales bacterium]|nr:hypothetical protein [Rhodocyclales bacterium]